MLQASFENGTPGNEVYSTDPGGPDAFDRAAASIATLTYDKTHARGLLAAKFSTGVTGDQSAFCEWNTSFGTRTDHYSRLYVYLSDVPPATTAICGWKSGGSSSLAGRVRIEADGKLRITDGAGTVVATAASAVPLNQWVRLELHVVHSLTVGSVELRVYTTDPDAAVGSYDYALTASSLNTNANATAFTFGWITSAASLPAMWIDSVAAAADSWVGPPSVASPPRDVASFTAWTAPVEGDATSDSVNEYTYLIAEAPDRLQFVTDPASPYNTHSLQVTVQQDDWDHNGLVDRTEIAATAYTYAPGQDLWIALAIRLDPSFPSVVSPYWQVFAQMFGSTGGTSTGSPPLALEVDNDNLYVEIRGGTKSAPSDLAPRHTGHVIAPAVKDVWHELLVHARLAKDSTGLIEVFHRHHGDAWPSVPQVSDSGANVLTVAGEDQWVYPETGLYRKTRPEVGIAYYGGVLIRAARTDAEELFKMPEPYYTTPDALRAELALDSTALPDAAATLLIQDAEDLVDRYLGGWLPDEDTGRKILQANVLAWQWVKLGRATAKLAARMQADPDLLGVAYDRVRGPDFEVWGAKGGTAAKVLGPVVVALLDDSALRRIAGRATAGGRRWPQQASRFFRTNRYQGMSP